LNFQQKLMEIQVDEKARKQLAQKLMDYSSLIALEAQCQMEKDKMGTIPRIYLGCDLWWFKKADPQENFSQKISKSKNS